MALASLRAYRARHCVTIYLPFANPREGVSRLEEALGQAAREVRVRDRRPGQAEAILSTAWSLYDAEPLWSAPERGLALFVAADRMIAYRLPARPPWEVWVDGRFHLGTFRRCLRGSSLSADRPIAPMPGSRAAGSPPLRGAQAS